MEQDLHTPQVYDFRQHDRIWQRVAPQLEPFPQQCRQSAAVPAMAEQPAPAPHPPATPESQLPGAIVNPCCMGSAAADMLEVITGFIEESLSDRQYLLATARQGPAWARQTLRDMAADELSHARRLQAVYYLITGDCYRPVISHQRICVNNWCADLRERYHLEACNGFNYQRAAEGTTDPCLSKLLSDLSAAEFRHADILLRLLERSLQG